MPAFNPAAVYGYFIPKGLKDIAIVNKAKTPVGFDLREWRDVHQAEIDNAFGPAWGRTAKLSIEDAISDSKCNIILLDKAEQGADFEGYHDMAPNGRPRGFCFMADAVKSDGARGASTLIGHEAFEMLGDPFANRWAENSKGVSFAEEPCDACEDLSFKVGKIDVTDWLTLAFFIDPAPAGAVFDRMGKVTRSFQTLPGGYQTTRKGGVLNNVMGSIEKAERFAAEDRRLHRSWYRAKADLNLPASAFGAEIPYFHIHMMTPKEEKGWFDRAVGQG